LLTVYLQSSFALPIEIFGEIACFVAGENDFGTLAALCATSKLMSRELKGILCETVVCDEGLLQRLKLSQAVEEGREEFRHTKCVRFSCPDFFRLIAFHRFIFVDTQSYDPEPCPVDNTCFPNLRAAITQELNPSMTFTSYEICPLYTVELHIIGNTALATIWSLLRYPLDWVFVDREPSRSRVLEITAVCLSKQATLTVGEPNCSGCIASVPSGIRLIRARRTCGEHDAQEFRRLKISIRTLSQFLPRACSPENMADTRQVINIQGIESPEDLEIWRQEVSGSAVDSSYKEG
jgi:hypothetical protein